MIDRTSLRVVLRTLARQRGFTTVAVVSLGVAIALNTTMYSVLDAMFAPRINARRPEDIYFTRFYGDYHGRLPRGSVDRALAAQVHGVAGFSGSSLLAFARREPLIESGSRYTRERPLVVRPNFFEFLGSVAAQGRTFRRGDEAESPPPVVISDRLGDKLFPNGSPVGQSITIDGNGYVVIGVVERATTFDPLAWSLWILQPPNTPPVSVTMMRLREGVDTNVAKAEVQAVAQQLAVAAGDRPSDARFYLKRYETRQFRIGRFHWALFASVAAVLLVACANLANLQLARGLTRRRELALRSAVGASRSQLVGHLLLESGVLAAAGLVAGVALTFWGVHLVRATMPPVMMEYVIEPQVSWRMLVFAASAAVLCVVLVGLLPALHVSRVDPEALLKAGSGTGANREHRRRYGRMIVVQIGLALPVLIGAIVLLRASWRVHSSEFVRSMNPYGYDPAPIVVSNLLLRRDSARQRLQPAGLAAELRSRALSVRGVVAAAASMSREPAKRTVSVDDDNGVLREEPAPQWAYQIVSPSMARTFGLPIVRGRDFDDGEFGRSVIMDAGSARYLWGSHDPIGRQIKFGNALSGEPWYTVVGILGDLRDSATIRRMDYTTGFRLGTVYRVFAPDDSLAMRRGSFGFMTLYARVTGSAELGAVRLQRTLRTTSSPEPPTVVPLADRFAWQRTQVDFVASLFGTFAMLGLGLVAVGVYGIVAYSVAERRRELAVRISLGATARNVVHSILREGNVLMLAGIAVGLLSTKYTVWWLGQFMFEDDGYNAPLFALIAAGLFVVAAVAAMLPALRATRIDPVEALRHE